MFVSRICLGLCVCYLPCSTLLVPEIHGFSKVVNSPGAVSRCGDSRDAKGCWFSGAYERYLQGVVTVVEILPALLFVSSCTTLSIMGSQN